MSVVLSHCFLCVKKKDCFGRDCRPFSFLILWPVISNEWDNAEVGVAQVENKGKHKRGRKIKVPGLRLLFARRYGHPKRALSLIYHYRREP